jgi:N-acetylmuramoyl-L-alanine amidase
MPNQNYWVQSLAMCRDTNCPAVLTENLFQDNENDVAFLLSDEGKKKIVDIHVQGILKYING